MLRKIYGGERKGELFTGREKVVVFSGIEEAVVVVARRGSGCGWADWNSWLGNGGDS